ncbi:MAG: hypothetical protein ACK5WS_04075 [Alphaproteobacteria bacterium]|jgi:hypothetical protein
MRTLTQTIHFNTSWKQHISIDIASGQTWQEVKEVLISVLDPIDEEYRGFECYRYLSSNEIDNLRLVHNAYRGADAIVPDNLSTPVSVIPYNKKQSSHQKIVCLTSNLKFSTLLEYRDGEETVASLKQKLSQFVGLSCTMLSLKKKGLQEFTKLEDSSLVIPLRDIYAEFVGILPIQSPTQNVQFYEGETSLFAAIPREADKEDRLYLEKPKHTFSIPEAKDIEKIENQNGEFFTHTKEQIERKVRMAEAKHLFKPCALTGGIAYFCLESLTYCVSSNASNKTIASILLGTLGSTIISGVLAVGAHYMLDVYSKSSTQDPAHER